MSQIDLNMSLNDVKHRILNLASTEEFKYFVPEVINEAIITYYEPALYGRQATNVYTTEAPIITWLDERGLDADIVNEEDEPPIHRMRYSSRTLRLLKIGTSLQFSRELIEDAKLDLLGGHIKKATASVARRENDYIFSYLLNGVADGTSTFKKGEVYANHILDANDTDWQPQNNNLDQSKIQTALQVLEEEGFQPDTVIMSPAQYTQLQKLLDFRDTNGVWQYLSPGASAMVDNGVRKAIGLARFNVLVTPSMPRDKVLFLDKSEYSAFYERRPLSIRTVINDINELTRIVMTERVGGTVIRPAAAVMIKNLSYSNPSALVG